MLGYLPIGFAYGILAQKAGLSPFNTLLISLIVFAGSAQLIAVELFGLVMDPISIILTTLVINLRHLLMSASLFPHIQGWNRAEKAGFAFELTDETFALHTSRVAQEKFSRNETLLINISANNLFLWAALPTFVAAILTKNLFIPVIVGMVVLILARYLHNKLS
jgi:4-azaleucine resistance transporter AzlC